MYTLHDYGDMILDAGRTEAYSQALRARVGPDSVVLDIGTGPGIFTLVACQAGARRVYAIEPDEVIEVAREAVRASGFDGRVEFIQALSTETTLPERVDVIVADVHGTLPLFSGGILSLLDARHRFLKPGGWMVPERDTLWAAVAAAPKLHRRMVEPWGNGGGIDYCAARKRAVNCWRSSRLTGDDLVSEPRQWAELNYQNLQGRNTSGAAGWTIGRACEAHGLCVWFDCDTAPGFGFSNSPACEETHVYSQGFFPWPEARQLAAGDEVSVEFRADHAGEDYIWSWNTEIRPQGGQRPVKAAFRQSSFSSLPFSKDWLRKSSSAFLPSPNAEIAIDEMILGLFHAGINLEQISRRITARFPDRFPDWRKALTRVSQLSLRYSE